MNTTGVAPTGNTGSAQAIVDRQGHVHYVSAQAVDDYLHKGFMNRVGQIGPYASLGLMGYGALTGGTGTIAGLRAAATGAAANVPSAAVPNAIPIAYSAGATIPNAAALGTTATTGAGMTFGSGSLASFFNSRGGTALVDAGTNLIGSRMQINAGNRASDIQSQYANRALDWQQQQYGHARDEYGAWLSGPELAQLGALLKGLPGASGQPQMPTFGTPPRAAPQTQTLAQIRSAGTGQTPGAAAGGSLVTLQAPTGETQQFAANDPRIQQHLDRGARRVG